MLHYQIIPVTPFAQNCSLLWCDQTHEAAVVDPGGDLPLILQAVQQHKVAVKQILLTHGHVDHCAGAAELARALNVPIVGPQEADAFWIEALPQAAAKYGFPPAETFTPARWLHDGDTVQVGETTLQVRHCPGHTPGHVVFHVAEQHLAFVGDVLFAGSIGRTDFPQGNHEQLIASIVERLWPMGDETQFVPGHGRPGTFGQERKTNPFVGGT
ncbi:MAG: MBL fold metallo-hydrolase [Brachymonas sp.]|nr:MBL fold metallo-hydrolase [Brachymonas sp.]